MSIQYLSSERYISMLLQLKQTSFNFKAHPNVYELVDVIKREEATSKLKLQQYESGAVLPARRRKV